MILYIILCFQLWLNIVMEEKHKGSALTFNVEQNMNLSAD